MSALKAKFQGLGARLKGKAPVSAAGGAVPAGAPVPSGAPIFLLMGSLTGCSYKDAVAYARGLAETYVIAPQLGRFRVQEDKVNGRFIYEVQEGGPGLSVIDGALAQLAAGQPVRIALANGGSASVEEAHGEVLSLIYPPGSDVENKLALEYQEQPVQDTAVDIEVFCGAVKLEEVFPEQRVLTHAGSLSLFLAGVLFMLTGAAYTVVQSGVFDADALLTLTKAGYVAESSDNPVWHLEKARSAAAKESKVLSALKKSPKGWSWELT